MGRFWGCCGFRAAALQEGREGGRGLQMVTMWTLHSDPGVTRTSGDRFARIAARTWSFLSPRRLKPLTAEVENEGEERYYIENATQNPYRRDPKITSLESFENPGKVLLSSLEICHLMIPVDLNL